MKERGLLLTDILALRAWEGYKTQTRHPMKGKALELYNRLEGHDISLEQWEQLLEMCPWGNPGDRIYVRETWWCNTKNWKYSSEYCLKSEGEKKYPWRPNIHMPRDFARTWADVIYTGIQHIQDITDEDCIAEGIMSRAHPLGMMEYGGVRQNKDGSFVWLGTPSAAFQDLWDAIYSNWEENPVVWVNHSKKI